MSAAPSHHINHSTPAGNVRGGITDSGVVSQRVTARPASPGPVRASNSTGATTQSSRFGGGGSSGGFIANSQAFDSQSRSSGTQVLQSRSMTPTRSWASNDENSFNSRGAAISGGSRQTGESSNRPSSARSSSGHHRSSTPTTKSWRF